MQKYQSLCLVLRAEFSETEIAGLEKPLRAKARLLLHFLLCLQEILTFLSAS